MHAMKVQGTPSLRQYNRHIGMQRAANWFQLIDATGMAMQRQQHGGRVILCCNLPPNQHAVSHG
jgi:hypothetical protein